MKKVEVLGTGCPKCRKLAENAESACRELGIDCELEKVEDIERILEYGIMMTPALVIDGEVKASGKVLSEKEIMKMLS